MANDLDLALRSRNASPEADYFSQFRPSSDYPILGRWPGQYDTPAQTTMLPNASGDRDYSSLGGPTYNTPSLRLNQPSISDVDTRAQTTQIDNRDYRPIKGLISDALSTVGESSTAAGVVESQRFPQQVADWQRMGQRYMLNPESDVRPDLQGYLDAAPSKLESIQEGTKFNKENAGGYILNPMQWSMRPALKSGGQNRLADWASFVSSKGLERGLGLGGSYTDLLKNWFGGSSGAGAAAASNVGGAAGSAAGSSALGASGGAMEGAAAGATQQAGQQAGSSGGGFSIGPWGYIAGAVIGVIEGIWQWADAEKQDAAMKKQARDEYEAAVKVWEANQNKIRGQNRLTQIANEKAERETVQARAAAGNMTKKQNFMNLIAMASGPKRQYQTPQLGR